MKSPSQHARLTRIAAFALLGLGIFVLTGWFTQRAGMVQLQAGMVAMVANTALCFVLAGLGLLMLAARRDTWRIPILALASVLLLLPGLVLMEALGWGTFGLDATGFHAWLQDGNPHPGRMAPNTCVGFMLAACVMGGLWSPQSPITARVVRLLLYALATVGLTGFVGYWLKTDVVFEWNNVRMAIPTAVGLLILASGLWSARAARGAVPLTPPGVRITRTAAFVLVVAVLASGLSGFAILVGQTEAAITRSLNQKLDMRVALLEEALYDTRAASRALAAQLQLVWRLEPQRDHAEGTRRSADIFYSLVGPEFLGVTVLDASGRPILKKGQLVQAPAISVPLVASGDERLMWANGLVLRTRTVLRVGGDVAGTLVSDQKLPRLAGELTNHAGLGKSGEIRLCAKAPPHLIKCFPDSGVSRMLSLADGTPSPTALPIVRALAGESGRAVTRDYRGRSVMAAFGPLAQGRLGLVVKQDTYEIYAPIRQRLQWMLPLMATLIGAGLLLLRRQVKPLAMALAASEHDQRLAREQLSAVVGSISDGLITTDEAGTVLSANRAAERIFDSAPGELRGINIMGLLPAQFRGAHAEGMRRFLNNETGHIVGGGTVELVGQRRDGSEFPLDLTIDAIADPQGYTFIGVVRDITARKQGQQALLFEKERLRVTLHSIGDAVITTDTRGVVTYLNPVAEHLTGWSVAQAMGRRVGEVFVIVHELTGEPSPSPVDFVLTTGSVGGLANDTMLLRPDGSRVAIEDSASPIRDGDGATVGVVLVFHDVSQAREIAGRMSYQASHDALTDLINRREFEAQLAHTLAGEGPQDKGHVLLYIDLDQFKIVNDTSGHVAGDELLKQVSMTLRNGLRDRDLLARLGGDEFAVLLRDCPSEAGLRIAESLRSAVADIAFAWKDRAFSIGASMTELLSAADSACYIAKDKGRNRTHLHHVGDVDVVHRSGEMHWTSRISMALAEDRFVLYAQRIVSVNPDGAPGEHFEVLLRMRDEGGELVPPMAFIPAAERYGLMPAIDRWVVKHAFAGLAAAREHATTDVRLSINLSGKTLGDDAFIGFVEAAFRDYRIPYAHICFEITETAAIENLSHAGKFINWFRQHGCLFSLDDFGTGMSSFAYLKHLRVDYLKIDGGFVKDIVHDPIDDAMVSAINSIGHVMGLQTVAEFVEDDAILTRLRHLGVDFAQGYGIHKPHPLNELLGLALHRAEPLPV